MARIFDVVEYPSEMVDEIVHRFPEVGVADLRMGSQVIVRESQTSRLFPRWACPGYLWRRSAHHCDRQRPDPHPDLGDGFQ